ncbi:MAG: hypothetical protein ACFFKA_04915 [Candidatus Thorarchaeota archaeon]
MEEFKKKPEYSSREEIDKAIGHILWGDKGKAFNMGRLIFGFIKKRIRGK